MTAGSLIRLSLEELGIVSPVETPSADQASTAFTRLNQLVRSWKLEPNWMYEILRTTRALTAFVPSYSVGPGGTINIPRPNFLLQAAGVIIDNTQPLSQQTELPIEVITDQRWQDIPIKGLQSTLPLGVYYDFSFSSTGLGRVFPYPVPNVGTTTLVLYSPGNAVGVFANYSTDYQFPDGYDRALRLNLAIELAPIYGATVSRELAALATEAKTLVLRANTRTPELRADEVAAMGSANTQYGWNYRSGQYGTRV